MLYLGDSMDATKGKPCWRRQKADWVKRSKIHLELTCILIVAGHFCLRTAKVRYIYRSLCRKFFRKTHCLSRHQNHPFTFMNAQLNLDLNIVITL